MWIPLLLLAVCAIFAGLAVSGASLSVILCVGFAALIASIWILYWIGSWWLADQLNVVLETLDNIREAVCGPSDHEVLWRSGGLVGISSKLYYIREEIQKLTQMAEFVGEQSFPNLANAVKNYQEAKGEEVRKKVQQESEEKRFRETLDAGVKDAMIEREKEANVAREGFRRSHQTGQGEE